MNFMVDFDVVTLQLLLSFFSLFRFHAWYRVNHISIMAGVREYVFLQLCVHGL